MAKRSLTLRTISLTVLTASYRICGAIEVTNTGVTGLVNDPTSKFMELRDVTMARIHMPEKLVREEPLLRLVKNQMHMICLGRRQDIGPQALARGGFSRIEKYDVEITDSAYEYRGILEWAGRFDFSTVMAEGIRNFVPVYDARIRGVMLPNMKIKSPAILFNRNKIDT
ncbi:MAG: hypothetical protein B6I38_10750, partial [Anaerolineaceae bacterium 4572_5.1]